MRKSFYVSGKVIKNGSTTSVSMNYKIRRSTQQAVLQKRCSTMGILLGKLIQFYVLLARRNASAGKLF